MDQKRPLCGPAGLMDQKRPLCGPAGLMDQKRPLCGPEEVSWIRSLLQDFAVQLEATVSSINEALQMKPLTFVIDACRVLAQARKVRPPSSSSSSSTGPPADAGWLCPHRCLQVLAYSCVYSYYNQETEKMEVMEQQTEALDLHTNALQILLGETLYPEGSGLQTGPPGADWSCPCPQRRPCCGAATWPPASAC